MKGIILAGGSATRIRPITDAVSKQLLPVYNKPMIYYPLSVLMLAGIRDVLIISTPEFTPFFMKLLDDGSQFGMHIEYRIQYNPNGLADAFLLGEKFINGDFCALILGDNILWGEKLEDYLKEARENLNQGFATVFGRSVSNPKEFGVAVVDETTGLVTELIEKPEKLVSTTAVIGLYFYDKKVCGFAKELQPSDRGELEITDLNKKYADRRNLKLILLDEHDFHWHDAGSFMGLYNATESVLRNQSKTSMIAVPEEIAYKKGWISREELLKSAKKYEKSEYGKYLEWLAKDDDEKEKEKQGAKEDVPTKESLLNAREPKKMKKKAQENVRNEQFDNDLFKGEK